MKKIVSIIVVLLILTISISVNASYNPTQYNNANQAQAKQTIIKLSQATVGGKSVEEYNPHPQNQQIGGKTNKIVGNVLGIIRVIGIIVSVGALMVIGIREMTASVEEKSIIKQSMPGYIIGAFLVMAMTTLPSIIYNSVNTL